MVVVVVIIMMVSVLLVAVVVFIVVVTVVVHIINSIRCCSYSNGMISGGCSNDGNYEILM